MARTRDGVGTYDDIAAAAVRTTGLEDFGGTAHEEGLRLLVDDLGSPEAGLTGEGCYFQRSQVKSALVGRLLTQLRFDEHPAHREVPVERPIFVVGLPRTGTTALHRLLNADPQHQGLELWLTEYPQPRPPRETWESDPVFTAMQAAFSQHHVEAPEFMGIHYMDATSVEECWRLLRQTGKSISYESLAHVPRYSAWLGEQDWTDAYARHKENLQLIGLHDPEKRWVLKNPSHLAALDALMAVYPDALVVTTHRDPVTSIASACSLSAEATAGHSTTFVGETIGRTQLDMLARSWRAFTEARPRYDQAQFVDVDYRSFVQDPVGTTRGIYEAFGLDWTPDAAAAVGAIDAESRQGGKRPSHHYDLADYGLTEGEVRAAFEG
ncbi:MAG: sulfotransferase family protein [Nocardioides sp.]